MPLAETADTVTGAGASNPAFPIGGAAFLKSWFDVYRADDAEPATVYREGEIAEAEPAVPGWRFPVDELFD